MRSIIRNGSSESSGSGESGGRGLVGSGGKVQVSAGIVLRIAMLFAPIYYLLFTIYCLLFTIEGKGKAVLRYIRDFSRSSSDSGLPIGQPSATSWHVLSLPPTIIRIRPHLSPAVLQKDHIACK